MCLLYLTLLSQWILLYMNDGRLFVRCAPRIYCCRICNEIYPYCSIYVVTTKHYCTQSCFSSATIICLRTNFSLLFLTGVSLSVSIKVLVASSSHVLTVSRFLWTIFLSFFSSFLFDRLKENIHSHNKVWDWVWMGVIFLLYVYIHLVNW